MEQLKGRTPDYFVIVWVHPNIAPPPPLLEGKGEHVPATITCYIQRVERQREDSRSQLTGDKKLQQKNSVPLLYILPPQLSALVTQLMMLRAGEMSRLGL
jgi:hypothetical protein